MALSIKAVPTLHGEEAEKFELAAAEVEANPETQDYRQQAKTVSEYLRKFKV